MVQSPTTDPGSLERQIEYFIMHYADTVARMSIGEFEQYKHVLLNEALVGEESLKERSNRYWEEINREEYRFASRKRIAQAVRNITKEDFEEFYRGFMMAERRRRLIVKLFGTAHSSLGLAEEHATEKNKGNRTLIKDRNLFAKGKEFFSLLSPPRVTLKRGSALQEFGRQDREGERTFFCSIPRHAAALVKA